jgi:hypothetical protein
MVYRQITHDGKELFCGSEKKIMKMNRKYEIINNILYHSKDIVEVYEKYDICHFYELNAIVEDYFKSK